MIKPHLARFFISAFLYLAISMASVFLINPPSVVNFVGPAAAIISGLVLIWGVVPLISAVLTTPVLAYIFSNYFYLDANLAVMSIASLTIVLQAVLTKQLVFRFVFYKKWLISRKHLFFFFLRVGPISTLVSASSILVISMLDNHVVQGTFLYTFLNTWAASMLVAVFFTPLLIMANHSEVYTLTKRLFVFFTSILGGLAIFLLLKTSQDEQQSYREAIFKKSTVEIERLIQSEVDSVVHNVNSLSALFKADRYVSPVEFNLFSESIFIEESSVRALEWAPIITSDQREDFEQETTVLLKQGFQVKERFKDGSIRLAQQRKEYAPIRFIYPKQGNTSALGLDVLTNPKNIISMQDIITSQKLFASGPIILVQDGQANPGILFSRAVFSPPKKVRLPRGEKAKKLNIANDGDLLGFIVAVAQFDPFFHRLAKEKKEQVIFNIQDISNHKPHILFGHELSSANRLTETITLSVFSRTWQIQISEKQAWFSQSKNWQAWAVLIGGTFGAVLFQMLILMMAAYSSELGQQVTVKTKALNLAKESSEQKNTAKSHFLQTLNTELRVPLVAMKSFVEQLKKKGINNKEVTGISHAGSNIAMLLDTMVDLSNIESGKITPKEECFDFYDFLQRTESVLKASSGNEGRSISFHVDESVPHYLNSDELYIQKLLHSLIESAHQLLKTDMLRISIKLHKHKKIGASLFFIISSQRVEVTNLKAKQVNQTNHEPMTTDTTALSMAIKYSQLLKGDTTLGLLSSGEGVLNTSIRVGISSQKEQDIQQGGSFKLMK